MKIDFDLDDLTNSALRRMVKQLLTANEAEDDLPDVPKKKGKK
jgi:hypothetical protein